MTPKSKAFQLFENHAAKHTAITESAKVCLKNYYLLFILRRLAEFMLCGVFIYVGIHFLILSHFNLPIWPATGVALTIVFLRGNYPYIGIFCGAFFAFYINCHFIMFSVTQALVFTFYIFLMRALLLKWVGAVQPVINTSILLKFLAITAGLTLLHVICNHHLVQLFGLPWPFKSQQLFIHWLAELNGILCLTPLTLMFDPFVPRKYFQFSRKNNIWFLSLVLMIAAHFSFIWLHSPLYITSMALGLLLCACLFAYYFAQIPTTCLLLSMGLLYLAGITDFTSQIFTNSYLSESYLTVFCVLCLVLATYNKNNSTLHR